jgi:hypothetical protein
MNFSTLFLGGYHQGNPEEPDHKNTKKATMLQQGRGNFYLLILASFLLFIAEKGQANPLWSIAIPSHKRIFKGTLDIENGAIFNISTQNSSPWIQFSTISGSVPSQVEFTINAATFNSSSEAIIIKIDGIPLTIDGRFRMH